MSSLDNIILPSRLVDSRVEAGCDEAGRGCIAGPVVAAAVILPPHYTLPGLTDSKAITPHKRQLLRRSIVRDALAYAVCFVSPAEIDQINILQASLLAMHRAVRALTIEPEHLLIDGNRYLRQIPTPYTCIVKGDATVASIAAASILAKTSRDQYMESIAHSYPCYDWANNAGYPTPYHLQVLSDKGLTPHHRRTFKPCLPYTSTPLF